MTDEELLARNQDFFDGKYGVMLHFLGSHDLSEEEWNDRVNAFDCRGLAEQLHEVGAAHLLFTLCQSSGCYPAPNKAYTELLRANGIDDPHCSRRDLIADLYDALKPYGIKLFLYFSMGGPRLAPFGPKLFPWDDELGPTPTMKKNWLPTLREFSLRYGRKICGWWVDACYSYFPLFTDPSDSFCIDLAAALRAGNPDALVGFNSGTNDIRVSVAQDWSAGEINSLDRFPTGRLHDGMISHTMTYLGPYWGTPGCARSNIELVRFVKKSNESGGVVTLETAHDGEGHIVTGQYEQLMVVNEFIKHCPQFTDKDIPESAEYLKLKKIYKPDIIPDDYINITPGKTCTATSYYQQGIYVYPPEAAIDGNMTTGWAPAAFDDKGMYWTLDLGDMMCIDAVSYIPRKNFAFERRNFELVASLTEDFSAYTTLLYQGDFPLPLGINPAKVFDRPVLCRYIRMRPTKTNVRLFIVDLKVFVKPPKEAVPPKRGKR